MQMALYWHLERRSRRYAYYAYFDSPDHMADQIFIRNRIWVYFDGDYAKEGFSYAIILCHVRKKDAASLEAALDTLAKNMLICGYPQYETEVSACMAEIENGKAAWEP